MENLAGPCNDTELNITNLNQQSHADHGNRSRINRLRPANISSHHRGGGRVRSTCRENVETAVEIQPLDWIEQIHLLSSYSPTGQDQQGGSAQGMGSDSPQSLLPSTSTRGHNDGPILPMDDELDEYGMEIWPNSQENVQPSTSTKGHIDGPTLSMDDELDEYGLDIWPDSQENAQPNSLTKGHIDVPSLPMDDELDEYGLDIWPSSQENVQSSTTPEDHIDGHIDGGRYSSQMPCSQEAFSPLWIDTIDEYRQEATFRAGYSPNKSRECEERGQIPPPNQVNLTSPRRGGEYVSVSPSNHIIMSITVSGHKRVTSTYKDNSNSMQHTYQEFLCPPPSELPHTNRKRCRHLHHCGMPVVVLDRNLSDELGRLFQKPSKPKRQRLESAIQEDNASASDFSGLGYYQGKDPMEGPVFTHSLPHIHLKSLSHINLNRCSHLRHEHSGGIPVVVLDRNQSDALGRLYFQMSPKRKKRRLELEVQEKDASANEFSGSPEYKSKDPMEGTSAGASVGAQKCPLFKLFKGGLDLEDANEILCPDTPESQQGSKRRKYIVPSEEYGFITEGKDSDSIEEDSVLNPAEGSNANEILCPDTPESQQGTKRRIYIVPSEEYGFITQVKDSNPIGEDTVLNQAEGFDANEILCPDTPESQQCSKRRIFIVPSEGYGFITEVKDSEPIAEETVLNQAEGCDANEILCPDTPESQQGSKRGIYFVPSEYYGFITEVKDSYPIEEDTVLKQAEGSDANEILCPDTPESQHGSKRRKYIVPSEQYGFITEVKDSDAIKEVNVLYQAEGFEANEILCPDTPESQQGSQRRIFIVPSEVYGFITEVKDSDPIEEDTVLKLAEGSDANEILCPDTPESQQGSKRRIYIIPSDQYGFITEVKDSDSFKEDTVLNHAEGFDTNEILCPDTPESQQGSKRRIYIDPSEEYGFITEVKDSDPIEEDTVLNQAEGSDANEILCPDSLESRKVPNAYKYIIPSHEYGFITEVEELDPTEDIMLNQAERSDALLDFNAVNIDGSSAAEGYDTIAISEITDDSANWKHVSTEDSMTFHHGFTTSISQDT